MYSEKKNYTGALNWEQTTFCRKITPFMYGLVPYKPRLYCDIHSATGLKFSQKIKVELRHKGSCCMFPLTLSGHEVVQNQRSSSASNKTCRLIKTTLLLTAVFCFRLWPGCTFCTIYQHLIYLQAQLCYFKMLQTYSCIYVIASRQAHTLLLPWNWFPPDVGG